MRTNTKKMLLPVLLYVVYYCGISVVCYVLNMLPNPENMYADEVIPNLNNVILAMAEISIILFILFFINGYKKNSRTGIERDNIVKNFIISAICSYVIYYIIGLLIKFVVILYVPLYYLSMFISEEIYTSIIQKEHFGTLNIVFLILLIPIFISSLLGFKMGVFKRERERNKTTGKDKRNHSV